MRMYCFGINLRFVTVIIFLKDGMRYDPHHHQARARRCETWLLRCLASLGSTSFPPKGWRFLAAFHVESRQFDHCTSISTWCATGRRLTCTRQTTSDPLACPRPCNHSHLCCPRTSRPGSLESLLPTNAVMLKTLNTIPTQSACTCQTNARIPLTWSSGLGSQPEKTRTSNCAHSLLALRVAFTARRSRQENPGFSSWCVGTQQRCRRLQSKELRQEVLRHTSRSSMWRPVGRVWSQRRHHGNWLWATLPRSDSCRDGNFS